MSWGNGNKGPWGSPPSGNPGGPGKGGGKGNGGRRPDPSQPDLDELIRRGQESFRGMFGGGQSGPSGSKRPLILIVLVLIALWLASGFYRVGAGEVGMELRFGAYKDELSKSGLNYHLPYPIETVLIPQVEAVNKIEVGYRSGLSERSATGFEKESLMLTVDRNIVDINFEVQWKIANKAPENFLFNVRNPAELIKPVAESAMREVIGRNNLGDILTTAQSEIAEDTKTIMQQMLDSYEAGIEITAVNLSRPDVPAPVIDEFQDVKRAQQDKETAESVAEGYSNDILPKAKGLAVQMVEEATAYKNRIVAEAEGDVARFISVYNEYRLAKDVTRKRIFLETMEDVLSGMQKVIIDNKAGNGVLPYLPLQELKNKKQEGAQ